MELTLFNITCYNMVGQIFTSLLIYFFVRMFLKEKPHFFRFMIKCILFFLPYSMVAACLYASGIMTKYQFGINLSLELISCLTLFFFFRHTLHLNLPKCTILSIAFHFVVTNSQYLTAFFLTDRYDLTDFIDFFMYVLDTFLVSPILALLIFWLLYRMRFPYLLKKVLKDEKKQLRMALASVFLPFMYTSFTFLPDDNDYFTTAMYCFFILLGFLGFVRYMVMYESQTEKLKSQETMLLLQQSYVTRLEGMQAEMRLFRHDYKNMLASMYLYARDGEYEPIQDFLQKSLDAIDESVTDEIRQTTHLSKIQHMELKSLLLTKLIAMRSKKISCCLEVLQPFSKFSIEPDDLCRCLGILLDNGIEAVEHLETPVIDILIKNEDAQTTFIIRNPSTSVPAFHRIGEYGYSTKGTGRGLGLFSYHKILSRYHNVFTNTYIKNDYFVQELLIKEG